MEENRYKKVSQLFINRVNTIEMMQVFEGKEKKGLKIYRNDNVNYYVYVFTEPIVSNKYNTLSYELYLSKNKNLIIVNYYIVCYFFKTEHITRYVCNVFKKFGVKRYSYDNIRKNGKIKLKFVIEKDMEISKIFKIIDIFNIISNVAYECIFFDSYEDFIKEVNNKIKEINN